MRTRNDECVSGSVALRMPETVSSEHDLPALITDEPHEPSEESQGEDRERG
jgi:hypothetical protein